MFETQWKKGCLILFIFYFLFFYVLPMDAFARAGGGRSSGSRGSRSSTPPRSYSAPKPSQPSQKPGESMPPSQVSPQPFQQPQSSFWRGLAGGIMGGILGGMLFRGLGFGGDLGGESGGIGLFEILLIGALLFGVYWFFKKRRQAAAASGYYQSSAETVEPRYQTSYAPAYEQQREEEWDVEKGLSYIRQMDPSFDEKKFQDLCMDHFFKIQGAWANNDVSGVKNLLTEEMFRIFGDDIEKLKLEKKINKLENIAVRSVDIVEAWQESGRDYITVRFYANLLDYTVDETTGRVVSGSKTEPVKFEEYWTFTRPVGNHPWQLSAISQSE
jgi:predicted lipid-binding transport protein (Tim44 family)